VRKKKKNPALQKRNTHESKEGAVSLSVFNRNNGKQTKAIATQTLSDDMYNTAQYTYRNPS